MSDLEGRGLSALLPLKISGRHYGDNLARLDILFSSLEHHAASGLLDELLIVARADELDVIDRHLSRWPGFPLRLVVEDEHFPAFRRFTRPWQIRPWQRQQIIKLNSPALTSSPFVLTLDPDVIAVKTIARETLLPDGRALLEPEARSVHRQWWRDSADLLGVDPGLERPGINVTPALLSTAVLTEVQRRLEAVGGRPWMEILLTSYCDWTEYTLYLLAAERAAILERYHLWADDPEAPAHVHTHPECSIWDSATASREQLERLFTSEDPGLFAVVQSNSGLPPGEVAAVAGNHFAVRSIPTGEPIRQDPGAKLRERFRVATRIAAQRVYRVRRALGRRRRRSRHPVAAAPVAGGSERVAGEAGRR
ncbi:MAG TPA: DUF6492 family protein [Solirubrobacterales bacterium]|nr:DUF6492 family protein [Solirubrobacterales bacterium]